MERTGTPLGARITQIALTLIIVGLVVFKVLPGIADWSEVGAALKDAPLSELLLVLVVALGLEVLKALEQQILIPKLGIFRAFVALENTALPLWLGGRRGPEQPVDQAHGSVLPEVKAPGDQIAIRSPRGRETRRP